MGISSRGFTLVECIIALALAGFAILVGAAVLTTQARAAERVEVQQALTRTSEAILEGVRAGVVPLRSGPVQMDIEAELPFPILIRASLEVAPMARPGLHRVTVRSGCDVRGEQILVALDSMVWQP